MGFWDSIPKRLKKIFGIDQLNANVELKNSMDNNTIKFFDFSRKTEQKIEVKDGGQLFNINVLLCSPEEKNMLAPELLKPYIEAGGTILQKKLIPKSKQIQNNLPENDDEALLAFYKGKLSSEYLEAIEMSLIIKRMGNKGEDIREVKGDIIRKYPKFGRNLCNLVSGGYFHNHFQELYDEMLLEDDFSVGAYRREVERTVVSSPFTKFINPVDLPDEVVAEILYKVGKLREYGTSKFIIHALSTNNVEIAEKVLADIKERDDTIVIEYNDKTKSRLTATLKL